MTDLENKLRNELARRSEQAPPGAPLAERIIVAATAGDPSRGRRGWPTWALPVLAAGSVAAIVTGVFVGVAQIRPEADPVNPGHSDSFSVTPTPQQTPLESTRQVTDPPTRPHRTSSPASSFDVGRYADVGGLQAFRAADLTFIGEQDAWAVGSAVPLDGGAGRAPAMIRTTDGGQSWTSMPVPTNGAQHIRFATDTVGYAWTSSSLVMTTDGGQKWPTVATGATLALEAASGNVIRVASPDGGAVIETADIGATSWQKASLPAAPQKVTGAQLVRSDSDAYVLLDSGETGTVYASRDNGASWGKTNACPTYAGHLMGPTSLAASPGGGLTVVCKYLTGNSSRLATSTDAATSFAYARSAVPLDADQLIAGDPKVVLVVAGRLSYSSIDGGASWTPISQITGTATFVGFESETLGRVVTDGGATVWTTTDGGGHWTPFTFPS